MAPQLKIGHAEGRPAGSTWVYFNASLPRDPQLPIRDLYHKIADAEVHLVLHRWGEHFDQIEPLLKPTLEQDMILTTAGRALVVRLRVPPLDLARTPEEQYEAIDSALRSASRLLDWYFKNESLLHNCERIIRKERANAD